MHEEIGTDSQIKREYNHQNTNYDDSPELDCYESDAFNQPYNLSDVYHIQDPKKYEF